MALPIVCLGVALPVTVKILLGYRVVTVNGDRWQVSRLMSRDLSFTGKDIEWWREIAIKTAGGQYKQLHIHAGKGANANRIADLILSAVCKSPALAPDLRRGRLGGRDGKRCSPLSVRRMHKFILNLVQFSQNDL